MARVSGPLFSLDASGAIGGALVASKWKGRNYFRKLVIPKNPKSAKQLGVRWMMSFIAQAWLAISAPDKATWDDLAEAKQISPFNAYVGENLSRWQTNKSPTQGFPAAETANAITVTQVLTGGAGYCTIGLTPSGAGDNWGYVILRSTAEIVTPSWALCVGTIIANGADAVSFVDAPLDAGTYHYRSAVFNTDGTMGTFCVDDTEAVT